MWRMNSLGLLNRLVNTVCFFLFLEYIQTRIDFNSYFYTRLAAECLCRFILIRFIFFFGLSRNNCIDIYIPPMPFIQFWIFLNLNVTIEIVVVVVGGGADAAADDIVYVRLQVISLYIRTRP